MNESRRYSEIFEYLSASNLPASQESTVVFGRADPLVAHAAGELVVANLADVIVITGGVGKDTGDLLKRGYRSEADYLNDRLAEYASSHDTSLPPVYLDEKASNGGENARNSLKILAENGHNTTAATAVAHATSARRLAETLRFTMHDEHLTSPTVYIAPTAYNFDPENPADQAEAAAELLRLADWPSKNWLLPQDDLPEELVAFVRDTGLKHRGSPQN